MATEDHPAVRGDAQLGRRSSVITIDFETYYDKDYSLTAMPTAAYVLDPRFEIIGVAVALDGQPTRWYKGSHEEIAHHLCQYPWHRAVCVAHNAIFDGAILEWVLGIEPARYFCTMMGSRPFVAPWTGKMSLATVADFLGAGVKGDEVKKMAGVHAAQMTAADWLRYAAYCVGDVDLARRVFANLWRRYPQDERDLIDLTIKKFTRPKLQLDPETMRARLEQVQVEKAKALLSLPNGVSKDVLMSNDKFAAALQQRGVMPPRKLSLTTMKPTWAFAKADDEFVELRSHHDPKVRAMVEARLLWKSTQEETRLEKFLELTARTGFLPVPLLYYGAHTGRFSGYDGLNLQNLPRPKKGQLGLRHCVVAPEGHKVVTVDLSQIEARIVATLALQSDLVHLFATGGDPYSAFATVAYGYPVNKKDHPVERFVGKTCILGLGYGMGAPRLLQALKAAAATQGIPLSIDLDRSEKLVKTYRATYGQIPRLWKQMDRLISYMLEPKAQHRWQMLEVHHRRIRLPNGMDLNYPGLQRDAMNQATYETSLGASRVRTKLWGGAILENIVQALARIVISRAELRLARAGLPAALQVHDELVYVVPDAAVERVRRALTLAMVDPVPWLHGLPLACEVGVGQSYGLAK